MAWARFDDRLHQNPKIARLSSDAFRLWVCSITFSCLNRTDGLLFDSDLSLSCPALGPKVRARCARELEEVGCWIKTSSGWEIHDFLEFNPSRDELDDAAAIKGKAGSYGNHVRWHVKRGKPDPSCEHCRKEDRIRDRDCDLSRDPSANPNRSLARAVPARPHKKKEEAATGTSTPGSNPEARGESIEQLQQLFFDLTGKSAGPEIERQIRETAERYGLEETRKAAEAAVAAGASSWNWVRTRLEKRSSRDRNLLHLADYPPGHPGHGRAVAEKWVGEDGTRYRIDPFGSCLKEVHGDWVRVE